MKHLFGLALLMQFASTVSAQTPKGAPAKDEGTELFRGLFHFRGITPVTDVPRKGSRDTIVVVYGSPGSLSPLATELVRTTLAEGGSVLIASDVTLDVGRLLGAGKALITGKLVSCSSPENCLGGNREFPLILDTGEWRAGREPWRIATNRPSNLRIDFLPDELSGLAWNFPSGSRIDFRRPDDNELFAVGGAGPERNPYRCMVLADQDVFSNQMLYASAADFNGVSPDNFRFADEVVKWLAANGTRKQCIFIENGKIRERFDDFDFTALSNTPNLPKDLPMPPLPNPRDRRFQAGVANAIDKGIAKVEDDNLLNRYFTGDNRTYGYVLASLLSLALSAFLSIFIRRVWQARHRPEFQPLPADPHMLGHDAPLGSFEHRRLELLRGGDFRGPVVGYLRRLFAERGANLETAGRLPPPADIRTRAPRKLKGMIRELWQEAFVFDGEPLPYTRWKEIERALAAVQAAADADLWRFRSNSETPSA